MFDKICQKLTDQVRRSILLNLRSMQFPVIDPKIASQGADKRD